MGWRHFVLFFKKNSTCQVSFSKEPYKNRDFFAKKVSNKLGGLLIVFPPFRYACHPTTNPQQHPGTHFNTQVYTYPLSQSHTVSSSHSHSHTGAKIRVWLKQGMSTLSTNTEINDNTHSRIPEWTSLATVRDAAYAPYEPYSPANSGSRHSVTFSLWVAGSPFVYFLDLKIYRDYLVAKHSNIAAQGGGEMTVRGCSFGTVDLSSRTSVGRTNCQMSSWLSTSSVKCTAAWGYARSQTLKVTVGQHSGSVTWAMSYDLPAPHVASQRGNRASTGSATVTIRGANFATVGSTQAVRLSLSASEATNWLSEEELPCRGCSGIHTYISHI